jgi:hypothetical protein
VQEFWAGVSEGACRECSTASDLMQHKIVLRSFATGDVVSTSFQAGLITLSGEAEWPRQDAQRCVSHTFSLVVG